MVKARTTAAVESAVAGGEGRRQVSTETPSRSQRLLQARKRSRDARRRRKPSPEKSDLELVGRSVDDAELEYIISTLIHLTSEERRPYYEVLNKRANMGLAWYNKNNLEDCYQLTSVAMDDVYHFMDGGVCYIHKNFKARNVATGSEELFFAELPTIQDVFNDKGGFSTTVYSIVDDNCVGMILGSFRGIFSNVI